MQIKLNFGNFAFLVEDNLYWKAYLNSIWIASVSTLLCLLLGYPIAYAIARSNPSARNILMLLIVLPFWTSFLLRVYAWIGILKNNGLLNNFLIWLGVIDQPIQMLQTDFAVYIGIVYSYLPFMILPLYANLEKLDLTPARGRGRPRLQALAGVPEGHAAAVDARHHRRLPAGVHSGGRRVRHPALLGGPGMLMIGKVLWNEFFNNRDWPVASAVAIALLLFLVIPIMYFQRAQDAEAGGAHR